MKMDGGGGCAHAKRGAKGIYKGGVVGGGATTPMLGGWLGEVVTDEEEDNHTRSDYLGGEMILDGRSVMVYAVLIA